VNALSWQILETQNLGCYITPPRGDARAAKVVSDELDVPKVNGFAEGESTTCQTFMVGGDGD
jgi:hypothetical protein